MSERVAETAGRRIAGERATVQALFASIVVGAAASVLTYKLLRSA
jgi:hypothetical protein